MKNTRTLLGLGIGLLFAVGCGGPSETSVHHAELLGSDVRMERLGDEIWVTARDGDRDLVDLWLSTANSDPSALSPLADARRVDKRIIRLENEYQVRQLECGGELACEFDPALLIALVEAELSITIHQGPTAPSMDKDEPTKGE